MRSTRPPIIRPTRCRRRRRRQKPTKTTSQRSGQCSQNIPPINTGDRKELGKLLQPLRRAIRCWRRTSTGWRDPCSSFSPSSKKSSTFNRLTRLLEISATPVEFRPKENDLLLQCRDFKCEPTVDFLFVF